MSTDPTWRPLREHVVTELQALVRNEHAAVIVSEQETATTPTTYDRTHMSTLWWRLAHRLGIVHIQWIPNTRFVQFTTSKGEETVYAECVGSTAWDGFIDITPETDRRLRDLGWLSPDDPGYFDYSFGRGAPMYRIDVAKTEIDYLADLAIDSLTLLGLTPQSPIAVETTQ